MRWAGGRTWSGQPPVYPLKTEHHFAGTNYRQLVQNQRRFPKQRNVDESTNSSEAMELIRIRRERVKLRVRAHRARKRAALQEAQRLLAEQFERDAAEMKWFHVWAFHVCQHFIGVIWSGQNVCVVHWGNIWPVIGSVCRMRVLKCVSCCIQWMNHCKGWWVAFHTNQNCYG